jgi:fido (protein-threonine AMPylation protein)
MALENKLGIQDSAELARMEEKLSKKKAMELFESGYLDTLQPGTFQPLPEIHKYLFEDIYEFAGKVRDVNLAKGNFRFAPVMYLLPALEHIEIKYLLKQALTDKINDRELYRKGIDTSYYYEGYMIYKSDEL